MEYKVDCCYVIIWPLSNVRLLQGPVPSESMLPSDQNTEDCLLILADETQLLSEIFIQARDLLLEIFKERKLPNETKRTVIPHKVTRKPFQNTQC